MLVHSEKVLQKINEFLNHKLIFSFNLNFTVHISFEHVETMSKISEKEQSLVVKLTVIYNIYIYVYKCIFIYIIYITYTVITKYKRKNCVFVLSLN